MSNLIDERFSSKRPLGKRPSSETYFICKITSEFSRRLLIIIFILPIAAIFFAKRMRFYIFSFYAVAAPSMASTTDG